MSRSMSEMVAVAAGSRDRVGLWAKVLMAAAIGFMLVTPMSSSDGKEANTEVWVTSDDAEEARNAIRSAKGSYDGLIW
jgi:hypothetical protein